MNDEAAEATTEPQERPEKPQARPRDAAAKLRAQAAVIAIDMEQARWVDPNTGQRWPEGKALSRTRIAQAMGYSVADGRPLAFMREPEWTRALEYERIRRETDGTLTPQRLSYLLSVANRGMLAEITRRVLLEPEAIPDRTLFTEARKFIEMQAALVNPGSGKDLEASLGTFMAQIRLLPPAAREHALRALRGDMDRLVNTIRSLGLGQLGPGEGSAN